MTDRKKVIKGLEDSFANQGCGYMDGVGELYAVSGEDLQNAIALLKEQEEQKHSETYVVIDNKTGKEADTYDIALHEDWAKQLCYCDIEGWAIEDDGTLLLVDECGRFAYADRERFKVKWIG